MMGTKHKSKSRIQINLPSLIATEDFQPTPVMQKFAIAYIGSEEKLSPNQILKELGHSEQLWYQWKKKPQFLPWLQRVCEDYMGSMALTDVHRAIYRRALQNSPQDAKMFLERFDKDYKPRSSREHSFPGIAPPEKLPPEETEAAITRSKARAEIYKLKQIAEAKITDDQTGNILPYKPEKITDGLSQETPL